MRIGLIAMSGVRVRNEELARLGLTLPQFVSRDAAPFGQLILLAATFLVLAIAGDAVWAVLAGRARVVLAKGRWRNRLTGGLLLGAGVGLALARKP